MKRFILLFCLAFFLVSFRPLDCLGQTETKKVRLNHGFEISIKGNPSTGYQWTAQFDSQFLKLTSKEHVRDSSKPKHYVGVPGMTKFVFMPTKVGKTSIKLIYMRPWEKKTIKTKEYIVEISR